MHAGILWAVAMGSGVLVEAARDGRGMKGVKRQDIAEAPGVAVPSDLELGTASAAASSAISTSMSASSTGSVAATTSASISAGASSSISDSASITSSATSSPSASSSASSSSNSGSSLSEFASSTLASASSVSSFVASASASASAKPPIDPNNTEEHPGGMVFMTPIFVLVGMTLFYWIWEKRRQQRIARASAGLTFSPYRKKKAGAKEWKPVDSEDEDEKERVKEAGRRKWKSKTPMTPLPPTEECSGGEEEVYEDYPDGKSHPRSRRPRPPKDFPDAYEDEYDGEVYHDPGNMYFGAPDQGQCDGAAPQGFSGPYPPHPRQRGRAPLGPHDYRTLPTEDDLADVLVRQAGGTSFAPPPGPPPPRDFLAPLGQMQGFSRRESARSSRRATHDERERYAERPISRERSRRSRHGREYASHDQDLEAADERYRHGMDRKRSRGDHRDYDHSRSPARGPSRRGAATRPPSRNATDNAQGQAAAQMQPSILRPRATSPTPILSPPTNPALFFQPGLSTATVNLLAMAQTAPSMTDIAASSDDEQGAKGMVSIPSTAEKLLAFGEREREREREGPKDTSPLTVQELREAENPFSAAKEAQYRVDPSVLPLTASEAQSTPPPQPLFKRSNAGTPLTIKRTSASASASAPRPTGDSEPPRTPTKRTHTRDATPAVDSPLGRTDSTQPIKKSNGKSACPTPPPSEFRRPSPSPATKKMSKRRPETASSSPAKAVRPRKSTHQPNRTSIPNAVEIKGEEQKVVESWSSGANVGISESPLAVSPTIPPPAPAPPPPPTASISTPAKSHDRRKSMASPGPAPVSPISPRAKAMRGGESPNVEEAAAAAAAGIEQRLAKLRKMEQGEV